MYDEHSEKGDWDDIESKDDVMSPEEYAEYELRQEAKLRAKKNDEAKRIRQFVEIDPFINILRKERDKIKGACLLRNKYNAFIRRAEARMLDYSDFLYDKSDFDFNYGECGWTYDRDHIGKADVSLDYYYLKKKTDIEFEDFDGFRDYVESGNIVFINDELLYDHKGECYDRYGNKHENIYFRVIPIEKYRDLDSRLLILYADYFIEHFGFLNWYKNLSKEQIKFLRSKIDKIKLSKIQKDLILGRYRSAQTIDELKAVLRAENSPDLSQFDGLDFDGNPFRDNPLRGKLIQPAYRMCLNSLDYAELDPKTFAWFMTTYAEYLNEEKTKQCKLIKAIYFAANSQNFKNGRVVSPYGAAAVRIDATNDEFLKTFIKIRENMTETSNERSKLQRVKFVETAKRNLPVLEQFFRFCKWFDDNKIGEMRHYSNIREKSHYWTLADAHNTIEDLDNPQLIRDGFHHNFGRVC